MTPYRLTTDQVADLLNVSPKQVREYVAQGRLTARCEGRRLYFLPHEVQAYCESMPIYGGGAIEEPKVRNLRRRGRKAS